MRTEIRKRLKNLLVASNICDGRISTNRTNERIEPEYPFVNIEAVSESISIWDETPRTYKRDFSVEVKIVDRFNVSHPEERVDDKLESLMDSIESIITQNETLNGISEDIKLQSNDLIFFNEGEDYIAVLTIRMIVTYHKEVGIEREDLSPLYTSEIKINEDSDITVEHEREK